MFNENKQNEIQFEILSILNINMDFFLNIVLHITYMYIFGNDHQRILCEYYCLILQ